MSRVVIAIPARFGASRLPGKPLRLIAGSPLIAHVIARAQSVGQVRVVVATDDLRIAEVAERAGVEACLTSPEHRSGSDRLAECAERLGLSDDTVLVNLQGDEPLMPAACLRQVAQLLARHPQAAIATLAAPIDDAEQLFDPNVVKVVCDKQGFARYFSRAPIPYARDAFAVTQTELPAGLPAQRHIGLYAYRVGALRQFTALAPTPLEQFESLEQLRALEHGLPIIVAPAIEPVPAGVDTEADLFRVAGQLGGPSVPPSADAQPAQAAPVIEQAEPRRQLRLAFVCMGNLCRSPLSEAVARREAERRGLGRFVQVASRGTHASNSGQRADLRVQALGRAQRLDLTQHRSRRLSAEDFDGFDLLLAHDDENLAYMQAGCPEALRNRVQRLMDFARDSGLDDVPDPYHGDHEDFLEAYRRIEIGVRGLFDWIEQRTRRRR
ncbi:MAG: 3-deoxy-manno-octulosonate cytidylyltransferase [Xanthomonadales bacterium]|nr:3-deoxy-manno-octulosonate cytidylyltransferase [Xanthomonadales bacterium]MCB1634104.1 3-deoxy-manno-octulosonate cytidylyltransferase [Xanthomonadales bacterium]MCB1642221.1 3-deoxy-manno-octulosonate cytidylyltransferase [Xanthomonadales bacterium]